MITLTQEVIPFYLTKMNVIAKENDGHLVLNRVKLTSSKSTILNSNEISPQLDHLG